MTNSFCTMAMQLVKTGYFNHDSGESNVLLKCLYSFTRIYGVTSQKTIIITGILCQNITPTEESQFLDDDGRTKNMKPDMNAIRIIHQKIIMCKRVR
jgi:hypothetical protein